MDTDVKKALLESNLLEKFNHLPPSHQREYLVWVSAAKRDGTRIGRIAKMVNMLKNK